MKTLNCGAIVDDDVYEWARHFEWKIHSGYAVIRQSKKTVFLHKVVMNTDNLVDHKNRNRLDCRRDNLREASFSENAINIDYGARGISRFRGVSQDKRTGKWRAYIQKDRKRIYLGQASTEEEAAILYDQAAMELHGEFAQLNLAYTSA